MTIVEMLGQSGILTLLGIGVVFGFLIILIAVVSQVGKVFRAADADKLAASKLAADKSASENRLALSNNAPNAPITAAIAAAVGAYRKSHK